jgi:hypothetical protein
MSRLAFIPRAFFLTTVLSVLPGDLAFLSPLDTSSTVGLSFQTGNKQELASDTSAGRESTRIVLRLSLREGGSLPSIAGDFTNWAPVRMKRYENEWRFPVSLPPGVYHFAFRGKDGKWFVPPSFPNRTNDGMGGWVAVLVVQ